MVTSARRASSGSCVTSTTVVFLWRLTSISRSITWWPVPLSRFPVGSSASRIAGSLASALHGHALLLSARQLRGIVMTPRSEADFVEQRVGACAGIGCAGDLERHA